MYCFLNVLVFLLSSTIAEIGDYDDVADQNFLRMNKFLPYQEKVKERIMELHCRHQYVSFFLSHCCKAEQWIELMSFKP